MRLISCLYREQLLVHRYSCNQLRLILSASCATLWKHHAPSRSVPELFINSVATFSSMHVLHPSASWKPPVVVSSIDTPLVVPKLKKNTCTKICRIYSTRTCSSRILTRSCPYTIRRTCPLRLKIRSRVPRCSQDKSKRFLLVRIFLCRFAGPRESIPLSVLRVDRNQFICRTANPYLQYRSKEAGVEILGKTVPTP